MIPEIEGDTPGILCFCTPSVSPCEQGKDVLRVFFTKLLRRSERVFCKRTSILKGKSDRPSFFQRGIRGGNAWDFVFLYPLCLPLRAEGGRAKGVFAKRWGTQRDGFLK